MTPGLRTNPKSSASAIPQVPGVDFMISAPRAASASEKGAYLELLVPDGSSVAGRVTTSKLAALVAAKAERRVAKIAAKKSRQIDTQSAGCPLRDDLHDPACDNAASHEGQTVPLSLAD
jgi:hypothetical protein